MPSLFSILVSFLGFLAGYLICYISHWLPNYLFKAWHVQAWAYLYPNQLLLETSKPESTVALLNIKYRLGIAALTALLSFFISVQFGISFATFASLILIWGLLLLAIIDASCYVLPDCIVMPLLWIGLMCNSLDLFAPIQSAILGVIGGYGILWLVAASYKLIRKTEGIGQGDFKLLALLGAWLGVAALPYILVMATLSGATVGIVQILRGRSHLKKAQAFGPYLVLASIIFIFLRSEGLC